MKPKQFFYILTFLSLALVLGGGFFYYRTAAKVTASTNKLGKTLAEIQVAAEKGKQLAVLSKEYEAEVKDLLPQIEGTLPKQKQQSDIANQLRSAGTDVGVNIGSLAFEDSKGPAPTSQTITASGLLALPVTFNAEGTYPALQTLLQRLENFPRQCDVTAITFTKGSGSRVTAQVKVNFFLKP